jgi:hypothetical protein
MQLPQTGGEFVAQRLRKEYRYQYCKTYCRDDNLSLDYFFSYFSHIKQVGHFRLLGVWDRLGLRSLRE